MKFLESFGYYLFLIIPILIFSYWRFIKWRKLTISQFNQPKLAKKLIIGFNPSLSNFKFFLRLSALTILIFSITNAQFSTRQVEQFKKDKQDFIFAVDVSNSMLVEDVLPNRLSRSKEILHEIINAMSGSSIGMVVFAGKAYTYLPITDDLIAVHSAIDELDVALVDRQGTSFGNALMVANNGFSDTQRSGKNICIISDGENHLNNFKKTADSLRKSGVNLMAIAVGTSAGGKIPVLSPNNQKEVKKNLKGEVIVSKLNLQTLKSIADKKHNLFSITDNNFSAKEFVASANKRNNSKQPLVNKLHYNILWLALALILLDVLIAPLGKILKFSVNKNSKL